MSLLQAQRPQIRRSVLDRSEHHVSNRTYSSLMRQWTDNATSERISQRANIFDKNKNDVNVHRKSVSGNGNLYGEVKGNIKTSGWSLRKEGQRKNGP